MTTRRQHYVWRYYLRSWAADEKIWCLREGKKFIANLMNIGQERDFYAVRDITKNDIQYIVAMTEKRHNGVLNEHNNEFINLYRRVSELHHLGFSNENIRELLIQFEEDIMSHIEEDGIQYLEMLRDGKVGFFDEDLHRAKFSFFVMIQFVRTKRMSEKIKDTMRVYLAEKSVSIDNVWPVEKYIDAGHMALSLFSDKDYKIFLLKNETKTSFITGDQPVFNIHGVDIGDSIPKETELYYPISPSMAAIISKNEHHSSVTSEDVRRYNYFIKAMSHEQIYADKEEFL